MKLTVFYDSNCPLCMKEMLHLHECDNDGLIKLVDLHAAELANSYPYINKDRAMKKLHGQLDSGEMLYGLDVTCKAWTLVGKYHWLKILRWPIIKPLADMSYVFFARYREIIAFIFTGKKRCQQCALREK